MNLSRAIVVYSLLRLGMFAAIFVLVFLPARTFDDSELTAAVIAGIVAAIASMSLSYVVLRAPRERIAEALYERRHALSRSTSDNDEEDAVVNASRNER
ncbi:DUF4229 domain-containing protein [Rathayibacter toxicus]|uniref:DUF4229 domain-containing protein n=1 Tax=Rathayibacter toxicus TaxID=145458 RepID=A0A0C5BIN3_9MICO|nr:DUF4229 domain-containing protein [Rathayibacter toxicus]AJM78160.1 hypothetical protein TI83_09900 [Rathayibacter toxicus]ALS57573.1 hypothetical protein APU90_07165 [Rathayibacter toxicus]KKM44929.1 hypothetical protein VT73_07330 [Rathayibacter toxicus]QOD08606.1 DUF4229 domain-containing protein [Rathayibacter toxicus]QOD10711.1 DUF4229 domain-containing protein [Rathayibacter toxicus]